MVDLNQHTQFNLFNFLIVLENIKAIHISGIKEKATLLSQKDADLLLKYSKDRIWGRKKIIFQKISRDHLNTTRSMILVPNKVKYILAICGYGVHMRI